MRQGIDLDFSPRRFARSTATDAELIARIWRQVGDNLRRAMRQYGQEEKEQPR